MAVYDTMNMKNKGGAVPTYQGNAGQSVYAAGAGRSARLQSNSSILEQTGAILDRSAEQQRQAGEKFAQAGEKLANAAVNYQEKYNEAKATELATKYRLGLHGLLNNDEGTGLLQTQQEGAHGAGEKFREEANRIMDETLSEYGEDIRARFYAKVNEYNVTQLGQVQQHEATEFKKWEINTATAEAQNFGDLAVEHSNNPELMASYLAQSADSYKRAYEKAGFSGQMLQRKILEHTSSNIASAIKKNIKNDLGRAETMLAGASKFMTAKDVNDVENAILTQRNYLETKALRAEQAAMAREQKELNQFIQNVKPRIDDAKILAWGRGDISSGMAIVDELNAKGLTAQATALKAEMITADECKQITTKLDNMPLPEAKAYYAELVALHNEGKDLTGTDFYEARSAKNPDIGPGERFKKNSTILQKIGSSLENKEKQLKNHGAEMAIASGKVQMKKTDGTPDTVGTYTAIVDWQKTNGQYNSNITLFKDEHAKEMAEQLSNSNEPFSELEGILHTVGEKNMPYAIKQLQEKGLKVQADIPLFMVLDKGLANDLYKFELDVKNPNKQLGVLNRANLKANYETTSTLAEEALGEGENREVIQSFPVENQGSLVHNISMLALYYMDKGQFTEVKDAVKEARKQFLGNWTGGKINGYSIRLPNKDSKGEALNPDMIEKNLKASIGDLFKDRNSYFYKTYVGVNIPEKLRASREAAEKKKISVINNGTSDGYIFTRNGKVIAVPENGRAVPLAVPKSFSDLSAYPDVPEAQNRLPNEGLEF